MRANGTIEAIAGNDKIRYWARVNVGGENDCWEWEVSKRTKRGYGWFSIKGKVCKAHRIMYFLHNGYLPNLIVHDCENPACCNPKHLLEGTQKQNCNYPGYIAKQRAANLGKKHSLGYKHTAETRAKMSAAQKARQAILRGTGAP